MKVLCALSGGVDSSVAAARLVADGHHVVGVTMRLWGGDSDSGCCSVADVDDARRVAQQLGIDHLVFNFSDDFNRHVVAPYVEAHRYGTTPNPCIECNRHLKFDRLAERADALGFDAVATGHHARIVAVGHGGTTPRRFVHRGADAAKDQSYVVHMLDQRAMARTMFPVGHLTKAEVRDIAASLGLRTAAKPDSQDVCFITSTGGREQFLGARIPFRPATVVDTAGIAMGEVPALELLTVGQRRGLGLPGGGPKRFAVHIDHSAGQVVVGDEADLERTTIEIDRLSWAAETGQPGDEVRVQCSAHGTAEPASIARVTGSVATLIWRQPRRVVAPGQTVVLYDPDDHYVIGGGIARSR